MESNVQYNRTVIVSIPGVFFFKALQLLSSKLTAMISSPTIPSGYVAAAMMILSLIPLTIVAKNVFNFLFIKFGG